MYQRRFKVWDLADFEGHDRVKIVKVWRSGAIYDYDIEFLDSGEKQGAWDYELDKVEENEQ